MSLGDDFDGAVGHFESGLVVDRVRRIRDPRRPLFCLGHGIARHVLLRQVRADREVDETQRAVVTGGRFPLDEVLSDTGGHDHAPGAQADPHGAQRRQEIRQPGLPHPVAQVQHVAAVHQQDVCLFDPGDPAFLVDAGQGGELQHAHGLPTQFAHGAPVFSSADETPCQLGADVGVPVPRSGDTEGVGIGDRFVQELEQCVVDARVLDSSGREKKLHAASRSRGSGVLLPRTRQTATNHRSRSILNV